MRGKLFGIKKTKLLKVASFVFLLSFFVAVIPLILLGQARLWFFVFCVSMGLFQIFKALLFRMDSATYLGTLLTSLGIFGIISFLFYENFIGLAIILSFFLASITNYLFYKRKFQLVLAILLFFEFLLVFLLEEKLINWVILLAINAVFLVLFICIVYALKKRRKG